METVRQINSILHACPDKKLLLARSTSSLFDQLDDFIVNVRKNDSTSWVCSLHLCWKKGQKSDPFPCLGKFLE